MTWQYPYDKYAAMETLTYNCGSLRYNHVRSYGLLCIMQLFYLHNTTNFNVSKKKEGIPQKAKFVVFLVAIWRTLKQDLQWLFTTSLFDSK